MTRVAVIGGTGHIGTYLVPRLVKAGFEVICVTRGKSSPYTSHAAWSSVRQVQVDREAEEQSGRFGEKIAALAAPIVIDLTCYRPESARMLAESLRGRIEQLLHCGTIWVHGHSAIVPTVEEAPRVPFGDYGVRKAEIEQYLLQLAHTGQLPVTVLHPGHLVGKGWNPINPQGNFNPDIFSAIAQGQSVRLPNLGMETVHHVHADDVAQAFVLATARRSVAVGESFHVVSRAAVTLRGFAHHMAARFGREAVLAFLPWEEWKKTVSERDAAHTWDHIAHSPNCSIAKARHLLGYEPRYSSLEAVEEAVEDMERRGVVSRNS
jgi:nucleoside-diphosphate-sugar epimerase